MESISPYIAAAGGALIGLAAALLLLLSGRIAGVSGMLAAAFRTVEGGPPRATGILFTLGLVIGAALVAAFIRTPHIAISSSVPLLIAAGFLVGFGARLGSGCTSGHGVCGVARLSPRSVTATLTFMAGGFVTVFVVRHIIGG